MSLVVSLDKASAIMTMDANVQEIVNVFRATALMDCVIHLVLLNT